MAAVLTEAATVLCVHGGSVQLSASQQELTVGTTPVLVGEDLVQRTIDACPLTGPGTKRCEKTASMLTGAATRLAVGGRPVLLDTAGGATDSTPPGTWRVIAPGQTTLQAD